jgi:hypothetical protein
MHTKFWSASLSGRVLGRRKGRWEDNINMDPEVRGTGVIKESRNTKSV